MVVQLLAGAAIVTQSRHRTNTFLDEINNHFFRPRGLYAMLMTYKPSRHSWSSAPTDITRSITKSTDPASLTQKLTNNLEFSSGKSHTEMEIPHAAPLIFPALDDAAATDPKAPAKQASTFQKSSNFISDYMDRRAQASYSAENPSSSLSVPQQQPFASRFSDPTHPANSGHLISLLAGGKFDPRARRREQGRGVVNRVRKATGMEGGVRKLLRQNVLYLMVGEARREMEREKKEKEKEGHGKGGNSQDLGN